MTRVAVIAALAAARLFLGVPAFLADGPYAVRALLYPLFHASWWHLAANCAAVWGLFPPRRGFSWREWTAALAVSFAVYPLSARPVIGFSNVIYAVIGLRTPPLGSPWWRRTETAVFLAATAAMFLSPRFSAATHAAAFAAGAAVAAARRLVLKLERDAGRYL